MRSMSGINPVSQLRAGISSSRHAWHLGRDDLSATASRTEEEGNRTNQTDTLTNVGRLKTL